MEWTRTEQLRIRSAAPPNTHNVSVYVKKESCLVALDRSEYGTLALDQSILAFEHQRFDAIGTASKSQVELVFESHQIGERIVLAIMEDSSNVRDDDFRRGIVALQATCKVLTEHVGTDRCGHVVSSFVAGMSLPGRQ